MLVFESAFSEDIVNVFNFDDLRFVGSEECPDGVVFWRAGMDTDDFTNEGFPSVGSVVHSVIERSKSVRVVSGVVTGVKDL